MSAATKQQAVNDVMRMAQAMRGIIELADELKAVATLEQAADETQKRLDKLRAEEADWHSKAEVIIDTANSQAANITRQADEAASASRSRASAIIKDAEDRAAVLIAKAQKDGGALLADAMDKVRALNVQSGAASTHIDTLKMSLAEKQDELLSVNGMIAEAKKVHAELASHIAALKAKFS